MRFSAPRSISPSPVRGKPRRGYVFGLQSDSSEEESDSESSLSINTDTSYSEDSSEEEDLDSEDDLPTYMKRRSSTSKRTDEEMRQIEETIAAIRLRARHHDPYEEWERQTRKDAYKTARKDTSVEETKLEEKHALLYAAEQKRLADLSAKQNAEVQGQLMAFKRKQEMEEARLREGWKRREQEIWSGVEKVIKMEEEKVRKKLEEERKRQEEEEKKRKVEELKRRLEEEKKKQEDEKKKEEEEEQKKMEEEQKIREENERKERQEKEQKEAEQRKALGMTTADEDWQDARKNLLKLKTEFIRPLKANREMKSEWSKWRRQITPKVGQMTNVKDEIDRISNQLYKIMQPTPPHHPAIYTALLSSLSKAVIEQAETEVTAEKRSAIPLAQATWNLLGVLPGFAECLWAKLVQRVGGWIVPCTIPGETDFDGRKWAPGEREKVMGYRKSQTSNGTESSSEFTTRVAGVLRVYFCILRCSAGKGIEGPIPAEGALKMFSLPRYWTWFARMLGQRALLETSVAAQLIYTALDVMGSDAVQVWGIQWYKMLQLVYEGISNGFEEGKFIGGDSPEGKASRVRVQLEVERIVSGGK